MCRIAVASWFPVRTLMALPSSNSASTISVSLAAIVSCQPDTHLLLGIAPFLRRGNDLDVTPNLHFIRSNFQQFSVQDILLIICLVQHQSLTLADFDVNYLACVSGEKAFPRDFLLWGCPS